MYIYVSLKERDGIMDVLLWMFLMLLLPSTDTPTPSLPPQTLSPGQPPAASWAQAVESESLGVSSGSAISLLDLRLSFCQVGIIITPIPVLRTEASA